MTKLTPERTHQIVEHLRERFKERHGIELTRNRRLMLLNQIRDGVAEAMYYFKNGKILYRVFIYSNEKMKNLPYSIIYCDDCKQILTVLPRQDSEEYEDFLKRNHLDRKQVEGREMTAEERTRLSMREAVKNRIEYEKQQKIKVGQVRLSKWNAQRHFMGNMKAHF